MDIVIKSVDHAPDDLDCQVPLRARLLRKLAGIDGRGREYWLAELATPISWTRNGAVRQITHLLLAARWVGTSIEPGARGLPVNIAYVTNDAILSSRMLELNHAEYVAIGTANVSGRSVWQRLREKLSRAPCAAL